MEHEHTAPQPMALDPEYRAGKTRSFRQENRVAKKLDGKRQRGSGSLPHRRGDAKSCEGLDTELLVECKETQKRSMRIEGKWLERINREALEAGKEPALSIEIGGMNQTTPKDWTMIPTELLRRLLGGLESQQESQDR